MSRRRQTQSHGHNSSNNYGQLRIIGGQWRGRKLQFPSVDGLRPSPDRVRETLFNWLAPGIQGARCLDLFAGSGALGIEALSRGAATTQLVELSPTAAEALRNNLQLLGASQGKVINCSAEQWLLNNSEAEPFDIIFLDPPFDTPLMNQCLAQLSDSKLLAPRGWLYLETAKNESLPALPEGWRLHREKTAGQVCYRLLAVD